MPSFVDQPATKVRKDPLGPVTLNQAQANIEEIDRLARVEHFDDGQHNALEVPWVLGHVDGGGTTGYLFDTTYGGGTITRPSTGLVRVSAAAGVIGTEIDADGDDVPAAAVLANVGDSSVATYPHVTEVEMLSTTTAEVRTWRMTSAVGSPGNTWALAAVGTDVAIHAQKQPIDASLLVSHALKQRRDFLTEAATDWNALATNQGIVRKALSLEHDSAGAHNVNRIAKASGWFRPSSGPSFTAVASHGVDSVSRISAGVIEVKLPKAFGSSNLAACFPQLQPSSTGEIAIVNGYYYASATFRFYIYVFSVAENKWARDDRPFFAAMFGSY